TKWLARMESTGLIAGERAHVPGHRVRKTVYRLTHEGWVEATKLRGRLQGDIVEVLAPGLDPTPMRVGEIPEIFPAYVNLTAAVSLVRGGRLDFTRLHGIGSGAVPPVLWGDTLRGLGRMFGRSDEQQALDTWASSQVGMLIVTGIAGIGKSTVVASWLVRQRPRPYIYWFEIHEGTTNSAFLRDLGAFLARLGKRGLTNLLRERDEPEPRVLARLLVHELTDMPILLVLDNFHRAEADLTRLIRGPVFQLSQSTGTKVLVISRTVPVSTSRRKTPREARPEVLRLGGLDLESSLSLLRAKGFAGDEAAIRRAAHSARGHPILLSFAAQTGSTASGEMTRYLEHEIWRTLSKEERTLLEAPLCSAGWCRSTRCIVSPRIGKPPFTASRQKTCSPRRSPGASWSMIRFVNTSGIDCRRLDDARSIPLPRPTSWTVPICTTVWRECITLWSRELLR